jgi:cytochrome c-type biogenesis protein CcmF
VPRAFSPSSRESLILANNVLLLVAMLAVMLGTLYPLFLDALKMGKISVGPPYFDAVFYPLMAPALFLMGVGPIARWRNSTLPELAVRLKWAFGIAIVAGILIPFLMGKWSPLVATGLFLAAWIVAACTTAIVHRFQSTPATGFMGKLAANSPSYYGMHLAHVGIAVFVIGITLVKGYESERDVRLAIGQSATERGYEFKFISVAEKKGPNYQAIVGRFDVLREGKVVKVLLPEKRTYAATGQTMTEADIDAGITRDLYVSLGEPVENATDGAWGVRIYVKPFINWIWFGCVFMAMGGVLAISDKRYRLKPKRSLETPATTPPAKQPGDDAKDARGQKPSPQGAD